MIDYYINGLRLEPDLYAMIEKECKRREALSGFWPGVYPVIIEALYAYFLAIDKSYEKEIVK